MLAARVNRFRNGSIGERNHPSKGVQASIVEGVPVFRVIVGPEIIRALREFVPDRETRLRVLNRLREQLEGNPTPYRRFRDAEDPEFLFDYVHALNVDGRWITLRFSVNDTTAEGYLFVEAVTCR
jgi:hypothetical protein